MEIPLCLTPGPAVLFVFAHGLRYGAAKSIWANLGILTGNAFYFILSATGLAALVKTSHDAFLVVKWIGAGYLVFIGLRMIFGKSAALAEKSDTPIEVRGSRILILACLYRMVRKALQSCFHDQA